jgi:hypothetical protein
MNRCPKEGFQAGMGIYERKTCPPKEDWRKRQNPYLYSARRRLTLARECIFSFIYHHIGRKLK